MSKKDIFGLVRPENDIHTLGLTTVSNLLEDCGNEVIIGDQQIVKSILNISNIDNRSYLKKWLDVNSINRIGFSYRLDPKDGQFLFGKFYNFLESEKLLESRGGKIKDIFFAGLPSTCNLIRKDYNDKVVTFIGDETAIETLTKLGISGSRINHELIEGSKYDNFRIDFAKDFIHKGNYRLFSAVKNPHYKNYGTRADTIEERLYHHRKKTNLPLIRVHVGPYNENRKEAITLFKDWLKTLSDTKYLDIVSIGSSQLSQSNFGENWEGKQNGGGVPINSEQDLIEIYEAGRPMLMRTYSGTDKTQELAEVYERTINTCWHALSFWWFNKMDGRGPHDVKTNLKNHLETLQIIAKHHKPFEPNISHHFSFRGGDDITYVLSSYLACITAKKAGIKKLVLQVMLNTPKSTWGIQDLAKARALLKLARELEDDNFKVFLQPRAGLDYFSPDLEKAKYQLAAVTAMMDDIEPGSPSSPDIVHVVSYCEAVELATPPFINESIQITLATLEEYRKLKRANPNIVLELNKEVETRMLHLYNNVKEIRSIIESYIDDPYTYEGLYEILKRGVLNAPYIWECRDEFREATKYKTRLIKGSSVLVDSTSYPLNIIDKVKNSFEKTIE